MGNLNFPHFQHNRIRKVRKMLKVHATRIAEICLFGFLHLLSHKKPKRCKSHITKNMNYQHFRHTYVEKPQNALDIRKKPCYNNHRSMFPTVRLRHPVVKQNQGICSAQDNCALFTKQMRLLMAGAFLCNAQIPCYVKNLRF